MRVALFVLLSLVALPATRTLAQPAQEEAARRFEQGLALFEEGRYDAALAEFTEAHRVAPTVVTLFNIGRVHAMLGHAVEAADTYQRALRDYAADLDDATRDQIQTELRAQEARVARLDIRVNVPGATIRIDNNDVALSPLSAPLRVTSGTHTIAVRAPGHDDAQRQISVAGGVTQALAFELHAVDVAPAILTISSSLRGVEVRVDETSVGTTPLAQTIPVSPGRHRIEGLRVGYEPDRQELEVREAAQAEVVLHMRPRTPLPPEHAGALSLHLPDAPYQTQIDGETVFGSEFELPEGEHDLALRVTDRLPLRTSFVIRPGERTELAPALTWTAEARRERISSASTQSTAGWVLFGSGLGVAAGFAGVAGWNETRFNDPTFRQTQMGVTSCMQLPASMQPACLSALGRALDEYNALISDVETLRIVAISGIVAGAALATTGLVLALVAPSESDIDRAAHARISLVPTSGGILLDGVF